MKLIQVEIPTKTLKEADRLIEFGLQAIVQSIKEDVTFTHECVDPNCDTKQHEASLPDPLILALFQANLEHVYRTNFCNDGSGHDLFELYKTIFTHFFNDRISNAKIVRDAIISVMKDKHDDTVAEYEALDMTAGYLVPELKSWGD